MPACRPVSPDYDRSLLGWMAMMAVWDWMGWDDDLTILLSPEQQTRASQRNQLTKINKLFITQVWGGSARTHARKLTHQRKREEEKRFSFSDLSKSSHSLLYRRRDACRAAVGGTCRHSGGRGRGRGQRIAWEAVARWIHDDHAA